jgi:hypothetical protein
MNGKQAKKIRKKVYGEFSIRNRGYYLTVSNRHKPTVQDQVICDRLRNLYQRTKSIFKAMSHIQKRRLSNG